MFRFGWIVHQLLVAGYGFARDLMYHRIGIMLEINMRVGLGKRVRLYKLRACCENVRGGSWWCPERFRQSK